MRTALDVLIAAPIDRVWRALTVPDEVERWAGVTVAHVPEHYPRPGQHATWHDRGVLLHDDIVDVGHERLLASRLTRASAFVVERYDLQPRGSATTRLRATWRGHPALADNTTSIRSLRTWCEVAHPVPLDRHAEWVRLSHVQNC